MKKTTLVCDENDLISALQEKKINICPIAHFSPDATRVIISASINKLDRARELWHCIAKPQRAKSLVIVRMSPGEKAPLHQPPGVILIPWCDNQQFADYFRLLLLRPNLRVYPDWFYSRILQKEFGISYSVLRKLLQDEHWAAVLMRAWRNRRKKKREGVMVKDNKIKHSIA